MDQFAPEAASSSTLGEYVDDGRPSPFVSTPYGYGVAAASVIAFKLIHFAVGKTIEPPASCRSELGRWKWLNIVVSWIHSTSIGIACIYGLFFAYPEALHDPYDYNNTFLYSVVSASTGYFIYDFLDVICYGHAVAMWEVLLHHVVVLNSFIYNVTQCRFIGYSVIALFVEVNTIFLHARKLIQMDGRIGRDSSLYRVIIGVNLATFVVCRFAFSLTLITYAVVMMSSKMTTFYHWSMSITITLTWIVNVMLFWRLVKSDILRRGGGPARRTSKSTETSTREALGNNNNRHNSHGHDVKHADVMTAMNDAYGDVFNDRGVHMKRS